MTVVEHEIKILLQTCGRCGGQVVGDNTGSGLPWQHVDRADDHHVIFGTPAPAGIITPPAGLAALEEILEEDEDVTAGLPAGGEPRRVPIEDLGLSGRSGIRQMMNAATLGGFTTEVTTCTGPSKIAPHHDPRGYRLVESLLVGFKLPDGLASIVIDTGPTEKPGDTFSFVFAFVKRGGMKSTAELKAYLKATP